MKSFFKPVLFATLLASSSLLSVPASYASANSDALPLKRVVITTSGLALYEHAGSVNGDQNIELSVRLDGVDDVLKSLVVLDSKGTLGGVSLPGRAPLAQLFRNLPFNKADLRSLTSLLNALRGAEVELDVDNIRGQLMNVSEENETTRHGIVTRHRISVLTKNGIKTAIIENLEHLKFTDKEINEQLARGLEALYANRIQDRRNVEVSLKGSGKRDVSLAYIQEAPLWKSAYRLVLPQEGGAEAILQGWAVLENTTGSDWNDVGVTLMSGAPVTYHQALYESYHVKRPELPVKIMDRVMPRVDKGVIESAPSRSAGRAQKAKKMARLEQKEMNRQSFSGLASADMAVMEESFMPVQSMAMAGNVPPSPQMAQTVSAAASETASQMIFHFPHKIDLKAGHSLMLPYAQLTLPAEQVHVYQPDTHRTHPLASVLINNQNEAALPPGILTLFDRSGGALLHVGDAEMPLIPKGEDRMINFALDTQTKIDQEIKSDRRLGLIKLNKGVLTQKVIHENTTSYTIKAPESDARDILIEHPRRTGWELVSPNKEQADKTLSHYRIRTKVDAGESKKLDVTLRNRTSESISLVNIHPNEITSRLRVSGVKLSSELRNALGKISAMRQKIYDQEQLLNQLRNKRNQIHRDQERIRDNLRSVSNNSAIGKRYLKNLDTQETELENILDKEDSAQKSVKQLQNELSAYVMKLNI